MEWVNLVEGRDQWRTLVNTIMNLSALIKCCEIVE
jgi:hypothetical protein